MKTSFFQKAASPSLASTLALLLLVVAAFVFGYPNRMLSLPPLCLLYPAALALIALRAPSLKEACVLCFCAGTLGRVGALHWLALPMTAVGGLPMAAAVPLAILVAAALSVQDAAFGLLAKRLWVPSAPGSALALGLCWYFLEAGLALALGFPWLPLSGALVAWPSLVQAADTLGAYLTGGIWAFAAIAVAGGVVAKSFRSGAAGLLTALALAGYGALALQQHPMETRPAGEGSFPVVFVEGNIDQNVKWDRNYVRSTIDIYSTLTLQEVRRLRESGEEGLERGIVVWPETAIPVDLGGAYAQPARDVSILAGMPVLSGCPGIDRRPGEKPRIYNRAQLLLPTGGLGGSYDKEHLVPFGEYVPPLFKWDFLAGLLQEVGAYTPGEKLSPIRCNGLSIGAIICYEGIFPWLAQARVEAGANVLVDISNDGWFGDTSAPAQHMYLSALRSVEQNRWLVRGTNTGISCLIDDRGRITFRGGQFKAQALSSRAKILEPHSPYHGARPFIPPACALVLALLCWRQQRKRHASVK